MASSSAAAEKRSTTAAAKMGRESLLRYVHDIIKKQNTPLHEIIRVHALPFLPAQSLLRFRSVSTSWNRHISSPFFAHTQSNSHRTVSGVFFSSSTSYLPFNSTVPDPFLSFIPDTCIYVVSSSNGLLLCRSTTTRYYVCNPATASWTAIPAPTKPDHGLALLAFNPSALNFDADYSIICSVPKSHAIEVFSSRTGQWSLSWTPGLSKLMGDRNRSTSAVAAVAAAGIVYWQSKNGCLSSYDPSSDGLITEVGRIPAGLTRWQIGEMDGRFCCVGMREGVMEGYELERGGGSWLKKWEVELAGDPWPMPFEGRGDWVAVWDDGMVMAVEPRSWAVRLVAEDVPMVCITGLPYISSMVAVKEFCYGSHGCFTCSLHAFGVGRVPEDVTPRKRSSERRRERRERWEREGSSGEEERAL